MNPCLQLVQCVIFAIDSGSSVKTGILNFLHKNNSEFSIQVKKWLFQIERGDWGAAKTLSFDSIYRRQCLLILEHGLRGDPIRQNLEIFVFELKQACEIELEVYLARLPFRLMLPVLLLQFPAFLILLFQPILSQFLQVMN